MPTVKEVKDMNRRRRKLRPTKKEVAKAATHVRDMAGIVAWTHETDPTNLDRLVWARDRMNKAVSELNALAERRANFAPLPLPRD